jgi:hypothetical protein
VDAAGVGKLAGELLLDVAQVVRGVERLDGDPGDGRGLNPVVALLGGPACT